MSLSELSYQLTLNNNERSPVEKNWIKSAFIVLTKCERCLAIEILQNIGWDLRRAIEAYYERILANERRTPSPPPTPPAMFVGSDPRCSSRSSSFFSPKWNGFDHFLSKIHREEAALKLITWLTPTRRLTCQHHDVDRSTMSARIYLQRAIEVIGSIWTALHQWTTSTSQRRADGPPFLQFGCHHQLWSTSRIYCIANQCLRCSVDSMWMISHDAWNKRYERRRTTSASFILVAQKPERWKSMRAAR